MVDPIVPCHEVPFLFVEFLYLFIDIQQADCFYVHATQSFVNFIPVSSLHIQESNCNLLLASDVDILFFFISIFWWLIDIFFLLNEFWEPYKILIFM